MCHGIYGVYQRQGPVGFCLLYFAGPGAGLAGLCLKEKGGGEAGSASLHFPKDDYRYPFICGIIKRTEHGCRYMDRTGKESF